MCQKVFITFSNYFLLRARMINCLLLVFNNIIIIGYINTIFYLFKQNKALLLIANKVYNFFVEKDKLENFTMIIY